MQRMAIPFANRATRRIARKAPSRKGCAKIERSLCRPPWRRRPGYDLRCAPRDHLDFTATRLMCDLFRASLGPVNTCPMCANVMNQVTGQGWSGAVWLFQTSREERGNAPDSTVPFGLRQYATSTALRVLRRAQPFAASHALYPLASCRNASHRASIDRP